MYLLMTLLSRGRMSDYADSSSGYGAEIFAADIGNWICIICNYRTLEI